ncbi:MAG: Holliday junction resolvase RecU [Bacilli bacterium]|nr:Holliday junction resolvase RecU [Bacilli bacterium]
MIKYPNGQIYKICNCKKIIAKKDKNQANRGMDFEKYVNEANLFYQQKNIAIITKRATPIKVLRITGAKITEGFFEKKSTTDYNGVFNGIYIDFEVKSTLKQKSFPLHNIYQHQLEHLEKIINNKGIAFFLIEFVSLDKIYFLDAKHIINFKKNNIRKSMPLKYIEKNGYLIKKTNNPIKVDFLPFVKKLLKKS